MVTSTVDPGCEVPVSTTPSEASVALTTLSPSTGVLSNATKDRVSTSMLLLVELVLPAISVEVTVICAV